MLQFNFINWLTIGLFIAAWIAIGHILRNSGVALPGFSDDK
jgi:hypothetical protein